MGEEEKVRVGPPPGDDQARPPEDPHPQDQGWQQEVQGAQARHWQLRLGVRGHCPQDQDHRRCLQRLQQRACQDQDPRQERHRRHRRCPLPSVAESHYAQPLARKKGAKLTDAEEAVLNRKMSKKTTRKYADRQKSGEVEKPLLDQFQTGRVLAAISSRPGRCGRSDGYILEGKELEFYLRKIKSKKGK